MQSLILFVHRDQELVGMALVVRGDLHLHVLEGSEVLHRSRGQVDLVETPILVAPHVL